MNYILQIIGAGIIGGFVMLMILQLNYGFLNTSHAYLSDENTQSNLYSLAEIIEDDFNLIGYRVDNPNARILSLENDSLGLTYQTDLNNDGFIDQVRYYTNASAANSTSNPNDVFLYREVNGDSKLVGIVTRFRIWTYNLEGKYTNAPLSIKKIRYEIAVQSNEKVYDRYSIQDRYSGGYIVRTIQPSNL